MPKISIYVSDEMKARMDEAGTDANWSAIAQRAFGSELDHVQSVKEVKTMTDVIDRLRASKQKFLDQELADGKTAGAHWAKTEAEFEELRKMSIMGSAGLDQLGAPTGLVLAMHVHDKVIGGDVGLEDVAFFFQVDPDLLDDISEKYVQSFVEGALNVWQEVADEL